MCQGGKNELKEVVLAVAELKCEGCGGKLKDALAGVPGVRDVQVRVPEKRVVVSFTGCRGIVGELQEVADKVGFAVSVA